MNQCAGPARSDRRDRQRVPSSGQQQQQQQLPQQQGTILVYNGADFGFVYDGFSIFRIGRTRQFPGLKATQREKGKIDKLMFSG